MAENTKIEWCDHTFNPWIGCTKLSPGCDHCYAEAIERRFGHDTFGPGKPRRRTRPANWNKVRAWDAGAGRLGIRYKVFCASMADVFDKEVSPDWRLDLIRLISDTPNLDWLLLTKRPKIARQFMLGFDPAPMDNLWLGTSVENQKMAELRIPLLLDTPAAVRFLSCEPLLEPIDIGPFVVDEADFAYRLLSKHYGRDGFGFEPKLFKIKENHGLHWLIAGGESGPRARPMPADWARSLRDQCRAAGVAFFMKQMSRKVPIPADLMVRQFPGSSEERNE